MIYDCKKAITALLFTIAAFMPVSAAAQITAMVSYADWCGPCQILQPKLHSAASEFAEDDIEIIYIDFTELDAENILEQVLRADPLPAEAFFDGDFLKTGFAYILADGDIVAEVSAGMSTEQISEIFEAALNP